MNNLQVSKLNMYKAVRQICESQQGLLSTIPAIGSIVGELSNGIQKIQMSSVTQGTNTTGITQDKATHKQLLAELGVEVSGAVVAYATKNKNNDLKMAVDYSLSDISRTKDTDTINVCQIIFDKAQANLTELIHYGLNAEKLQSLQVSIEDFSHIISKRQDKKGTRVAATKDLDILFEETDILLKNILDKLMLSFKKSDVNFYNKYTYARQVIELGKRSKSEAPLLVS